MYKQARLLLVLVVLASSAIVQLNQFPTGKINLQSISGNFLAVCDNCGNATYNYSAGIYSSDPTDPFAIWTVQAVGTQVAIKSDINGKYLARCTSCWNNATQSDAAFVYADLSNPLALWTPQKLGSGRWALRSNNGKCLASCSNCVPGGSYSDFAFVHINSPNNLVVAQWNIHIVFPAGRINLIANSGNFLGRCDNCGPASYVDSAAIYSINPDDSKATWMSELVGEQVQFKSDNGKYLGLCSNCWDNSFQGDAVFVQAGQLSAEALWMPQYLQNGKWALRGTNGKYLAQCSNCVTGGIHAGFAFAHITSRDSPEAQWTILSW